MKGKPRLATIMLIALATALVGLPVTGADPSPPFTAICAGFEEHPGQGPSRQAEHGLWEVCLDDGTTLLTHGADPAVDDVEEAGVPTSTPETGVRAPVCVPATQPHHHVIYAFAADQTDRFADMADRIRTLIALANGQLQKDAAEFGAEVSLPFLCDEGRVLVSRAPLTTSRNADSFASIVSDVKGLGFSSSLAKYWIWYEDCPSICYGGQGNFRLDDRLLATNYNNAGGSYGITYAVNGFSTMLHENGHNMGAVQYSAPHSSGAAHCNDGMDIMCYDDDGSKSAYSSTVCVVTAYDCNHDDYFHPDPPAGNYLATHWNIASSLNKFVRTGNVPDPPSFPAALSAAEGLLANGIGVPIRLVWEAPATSGDAPITNYLVYRTDPGGAPSRLLARVAGDARTYDDTTYPATGGYTYRVSALSTAGEGPKSVGVQVNGVRETVPPSLMRPDLTVLSITPSPTQLESGTMGYVTAVVKNQGAAASVPTRIQFSYDTANIMNLAVPALAPGASTSLLANWRPVGGDHVLQAQADSGNILVESDETNNVAQASVHVIRRLVDLTPEQQSESLPVRATGLVEFDVWNNGTETETIVLSHRVSGSGWRVTLGSSQVTLAPGASATVQATLKAPSKDGSSTLYITGASSVRSAVADTVKVALTATR